MQAARRLIEMRRSIEMHVKLRVALAVVECKQHHSIEMRANLRAAVVLQHFTNRGRSGKCRKIKKQTAPPNGRSTK